MRNTSASRTRRGSLLFLLIMLVAVLTLIAFAFVRTIQLNTAASKADAMYLLTEGAAQSGVEHAVEAILADYAKTSVKLKNGSGGVSTISNPPTVLEGAWRQPFTSLFRPNTRHNFGNVAESDDLSAWDDVREEDLTDSPLAVGWWYGWNYAAGQPFNNGYTYHDGRGRFHEPGFTNRPWLGSESGPVPTQPAVPLRFTDPAPTVPDRTKGLWLDDQLRPVVESDPIVARRLARYRLRYAVGVEDLDGALLANGDVWLEHPGITDTDPAGSLSASGTSGNESNLARLQRLVRWSPVFFNLNQTIGDTVGALRAEHVFFNRGSATSYAKAPDGFPVTWPLMWREVQQSNGSPGHWPVFCFSPGNAYPTQLYQFTDGGGTPVTTASLAGGSPLSRDAVQNLSLTLGGPQYSFENLRLANGNAWEGGNGEKSVFHRMFTPFGRGMSVNAEVAPYKDDVDCPWRVNVMTAPRNVVSAMLNAYIPSRTRTGHYDSITYYPENQDLKGGGPFPHKGSPDLVLTADVNRAEQSRDCFNRKFNASFAAYKGPTKSTGLDTALEPNWMTPDVRPLAERYPGPLMAAEPLASLGVGQGPDDCGKDVATMDVSKPNWTTAGYCIYSQGGFFNTPGDVGFAPPSDPGTTKPPDWTTRLQSDKKDGNGNNVEYYVWNWAYLKTSAQKYLYKDSYFFDMSWAMAQAISILRMQWSQYDNKYGTSWAPTLDKNFSPSALRDPSSYQTLADLDRLFLENLGIDIAHPSSDTVTDGWIIGWLWMDPWKVTRGNLATNNIRTLRKKDKLASTPAGSYNSLDRSRVMELVLNDYRMSFLGSNPDYRGQFRPLDFNGDGVVHCSCYSSNLNDLTRPTVSDSPAESSLPTLLTHAETLKMHIDQWRPVVANDQGPAIETAFSISGNFFIGKSRYYRVITRGELWDNLVQRPVSGLTLDSVVAVDPAVTGTTGLNGTSILYQRYHWNKYRGAMSRTGE